ncbi:hypothetical protein IF188_08065 [Microbacterium sp. NEAU-LLC]|uniref:DNA-binding protein n=1 Tax=Microbacterium helvum TaxID=2773713 RepID=A0ABR8NMJ1_9MICO|nr:hypothetical protein [Microbacterium helvum]MBD3941648.1 hypothetical protein [Microbacterium helvum]
MSQITTAPPRDIPLGNLRDIPARMSIPVAGRLIAGLSRAKSYELHQRGEFPAPVQRIGARFYVRGADVLRALGFDPEAVLLGSRTATPAPADDAELSEG